MPGHRDTAALALTVLMTVAIGVSHAAERRGDDCLVGWRVGTETAARPGSRRVVCRDGDPACDGDGAADGVCSVAVALCRALPGCEGRDAGDVALTGVAGRGVGDVSVVGCVGSLIVATRGRRDRHRPEN